MTNFPSIVIAWAMFTIAFGGCLWLASSEHLVERITNGTAIAELRRAAEGR
jgi:hypothetical protein